MQCIGCLEVGNERIKEGSELVEGIVIRLPLGNVVSVVVQVKKLENEGESVSFEDLSGLSYILCT